MFLFSNQSVNAKRISEKTSARLDGKPGYIKHRTVEDSINRLTKILLSIRLLKIKSGAFHDDLKT